MPRYYNNPQMGAAFENLASALGPPSAAAQAAYANAQATREKAARLAELYQIAQGPNFNQQTFDRMGVAAGLYNPNQSYYSVDTANATSRANNAADNTRALQQTGMQQRGETDRAMLAPVARDATRFVPPAMAQQYGVPEQQIGVVAAAPGEVNYLPNGEVVRGDAKPLTQAEVMGGATQGLIDSGALNQQMLLDMIMGKEAPVQVIGPDGKAAYMAPGTAARTGAQPAPPVQAPTETAKLIQERDSLPQNDPRRASYDARLAALGRGQSQSAYDKTVDEELAKLGGQIYANASGAVADQNTLRMLQQAVDDTSATQGALGPATLQLRKLANALGFDAGDTSAAEMINALGNQLALRLRDPSNGAGMPGSLSDSDRQFLASMSASLGNSPEANRKLVSVYLATQQKNIGLEQLRQDYIQRNGRLDEGFRALAANYQRNFYAQLAPPAGGPPQPPAPPAPPGPPGPPGTGAAQSGPVRVNTPEEARRLPPGTKILLPDGTEGTVPGGR